MLLLGTILGFVLGAYSYWMWGNHRAKFYKKELKKALELMDEYRDLNSKLSIKLDRFEFLDNMMNIKGKSEEINLGIQDAINSLGE